MLTTFALQAYSMILDFTSKDADIVSGIYSIFSYTYLHESFLF